MLLDRFLTTSRLSDAASFIAKITASSEGLSGIDCLERNFSAAALPILVRKFFSSSLRLKSLVDIGRGSIITVFFWYFSNASISGLLLRVIDCVIGATVCFWRLRRFYSFFSYLS